MCVCGMLHPVLDLGPQGCRTGSQGERTVLGVGGPTQGPDRAQHAHVRAQGLCTAPGVARDSALISAACRVSSCFEGGPCVEWSCRNPRDPKGFVRACLPGTSQEGAQLPCPPPPILATKMWRASPPGRPGSGAAENQRAFSGSVWRISCPQCPVILPKGLCLFALCSAKPHLPILDL